MASIDIKPPVFAHRGASGYAPENTILSFTKAAQLGIKWIELDVMLTSDKVPIIMHDETLDRTTNGHGPVVEKTCDYIRTLDAGSWFDPKYAGERVPSLVELIEFLKNTGMSANVELKPLPDHEEELVVRVLEVMGDYLKTANSNILFSSFSVAALDHLRRLAPDCQIGLLMEEWLPDWQAIAKRLRCVSVNPGAKMLTPESAREIKAMGKALFVYTVDDPDFAKELYSWGVDAIFSNQPGKIYKPECCPNHEGANESGYRFRLK